MPMLPRTRSQTRTRFRRLPLRSRSASLRLAAASADEAALKAEIAELRAQIASNEGPDEGARRAEAGAAAPATRHGARRRRARPPQQRPQRRCRADGPRGSASTGSSRPCRTQAGRRSQRDDALRLRRDRLRPSDAIRQRHAGRPRARGARLGHRFDDRTRMAAELEVEHAVASADDKGEVEIEQFYAERQFTRRSAAAPALFLIPIGFLNEHHEPTQYYGVFRNFVETSIIPTTWREGGLRSTGGTPSASTGTSASPPASTSRTGIRRRAKAASRRSAASIRSCSLAAAQGPVGVRVG